MRGDVGPESTLDYPGRARHAPRRGDVGPESTLDFPGPVTRSTQVIQAGLGDTALFSVTSSCHTASLVLNG